jgi:hypothetical protein
MNTANPYVSESLAAGLTLNPDSKMIRERVAAAGPILMQKLPQMYRIELAGEHKLGLRDGLIQRLIHSVITLVITRHVAFGAPLECPPVVVEAFRRAAGFEWDMAEGRPHGDLVSCTACGYTLPASFATCPLCKNRTAPFEFESSGISGKHVN